MPESEGYRPVEDEVEQRQLSQSIFGSLKNLASIRWSRAVEMVILDEKTLQEAGKTLGATREGVRYLKLMGLSYLKVDLRRYKKDLNL